MKSEGAINAFELYLAIENIVPKMLITPDISHILSQTFK